MQLCKITLRETRMNLVTPFETSLEIPCERRILLVEADVDRMDRIEKYTVRKEQVGR